MWVGTLKIKEWAGFGGSSNKTEWLTRSSLSCNYVVSQSTRRMIVDSSLAKKDIVAIQVTVGRDGAEVVSGRSE